MYKIILIYVHKVLIYLIVSDLRENLTNTITRIIYSLFSQLFIFFTLIFFSKKIRVCDRHNFFWFIFLFARQIIIPHTVRGFILSTKQCTILFGNNIETSFLWADFVNKNRCISVRLVSEEGKPLNFENFDNSHNSFL